MAIKKRLPFKRKFRHLTDYKKRINLLKSGMPRLVVRKSNKYIICQIISFNTVADRVLLTVISKVLDKYGWFLSKKNIPAAYLTGLLIGKKALSLGIHTVILDIGRYRNTKGNRFYALALGLKHAGLEIPLGLKFDAERITGKHIARFYKDHKHANQFGMYKSKSLKPENIPLLFEKVKGEILGSITIKQEPGAAMQISNKQTPKPSKEGNNEPK